MAFFGTTSVELWRRTPALSGQSDDVWTLVRTYDLEIQPFTGDDSLQNSQRFQNVREYAVADDPLIDLKYGDELFYEGATHRVHYVERYRAGSPIPHAAIYLTESQWERPNNV